MSLGRSNLQTIVYYLQILAENLDRDKTLRLTQYFARLSVWVSSHNNSSINTLSIWRLLVKQTALVRRLSRLGKNFQYYRSLIETYFSTDKDPIDRFITMGYQMGIAGFLSCDALIALDTLGFCKLKSLKRVQLEASRMWSVAILCNIIAALRALRRLRLQGRLEGREDLSHHQQIATTRKIYQLQLCSYLCDLIISTAAFRSFGVSDGIIGISGVTSTVISAVLSGKMLQSI